MWLQSNVNTKIVWIDSVNKRHGYRRLDFSKFYWRGKKTLTNPFSWLELDSDSTRIRPIFSPNSTRIRQTRTFFLVRVMTRIRLELASFGKKPSQLDSIRLDFFFPTRFTPKNNIRFIQNMWNSSRSKFPYFVKCFVPFWLRFTKPI